MHGLLHPDPARRLSARQALRHPFFSTGGQLESDLQLSEGDVAAMSTAGATAGATAGSTADATATTDTSASASAAFAAVDSKAIPIATTSACVASTAIATAGSNAAATAAATYAASLSEQKDDGGGTGQMATKAAEVKETGVEVAKSAERGDTGVPSSPRTPWEERVTAGLSPSELLQMLYEEALVLRSALGGDTTLQVRQSIFNMRRACEEEGRDAGGGGTTRKVRTRS